MNHSNGADKMRQLQLQAVAQNLYTLANRHRESRNFAVAHALYGRALEVAGGLGTPQANDEISALVHKIENDQQAVYELHSENLAPPSAPEKNPAVRSPR